MIVSTQKSPTDTVVGSENPHEGDAREGGSTVLIIDDSSTVRSAMSVYLHRNGYVVASAADGFSGMGLLGKIKPIIIFADIVMPRIGGYEFCVLINSNEQLKDIPVVLVSSKDQVFDRARAKVSGCRAFLSKPFTEKQLLDMIADHALPPHHPLIQAPA
ncbi:MAG: response regulator [Proteobacteria bacterium]|nr:response regulator [Pseudomonadota bacterium]